MEQVFKSVGSMLRSTTVGWYCQPLFRFVRNCPSVLQSGSFCIPAPQHCMKVPVSPHLLQQLVVVGFFVGGLGGICCFALFSLF